MNGSIDHLMPLQYQMLKAYNATGGGISAHCLYGIAIVVIGACRLGVIR